METTVSTLRSDILQLVSKYYLKAFPSKEFIAGTTPIPVSGKVFDASELQYLVDSALDFWLTAGRFTKEFETIFSTVVGVRYSLLVNSGSSANQIALSCLTSSKLKDRRLKPGDEVLTIACAFPTTVNPILINRLTPVFVDVQIPSYNVDISQLEKGLTSKTRAIVLAHTLGNPFDLKAVCEFAKKHRLWLIEDCCDALGSTYRGKNVGSFGDLATVSFFPAHHMTMGEGGCVLTNNSELKRLIVSFRDWGRDCWCLPGHANTCGKRFDQQFGSLPFGYDHKYTYTHIGYNVKVTDMQAAIGVAQLKKLDHFIKIRKHNFQFLYKGLADLQDHLILPKATPEADPSWFGFPIAIQPNTGLTRTEIIKYLESRKIATRLLFAGNIIRQPAFEQVQYRVAATLTNSDFVMNQVFWIGVFPGLTEPMLQFVVDTFHEKIALIHSS